MAIPVVCFSLVLYKHNFDSIKPLLASISSLSSDHCGFRIILSVYDGSPPTFLSPTIDEFKNFDPLLNTLLEKGRNIGFGRANNRNFTNSGLADSDLFVVVNPDIRFHSVQLLPLLAWAFSHDEFSCIAPLVLLNEGGVQFSAKRNPTVLSLLLGRFDCLLSWTFFRQYDDWHKNLDKDYLRDLIESSYLSGCFLIIPASAFYSVGGFCDRYFLHVEDADLVRRLSMIGKTIHNPVGVVVHGWARGSHSSIRQILSLIKSFVVYCSIWGVRIF